MRLCVVSFKDCWQDASGLWFSYGGFPGQMAAISSLFDETTLVIVRGESRNNGIPLPKNARVVPLDEPIGVDMRRKLSVLINLPNHLRVIFKNIRQADVVHIPVPGDIAFLGLVSALILNKPLIARYGGSWENNARTSMMNKLTKWLMRTFAGNRNVMLATGNGSVPPAPNMNWIFSTAITQDEIDRIKPNLDRELSTPPCLVYIGRLSPEKGLPYLLHSISLLKKKGLSPLPSVTLIGDGPDRVNLIEKAKELGIQEQITFTGQLDRPKLIPILLHSDICIIPSLTEGFNKATLDAMLCGMPVITTNVGSGVDTIGKNGERGWIIPPGDAKVMADTIENVLTGSVDWHAIRARSRQYVEQFTLEAWTEKIRSFCAKQWNVSVIEGKLR